MNSDGLMYSTDALNVKSYFYNKEVSVYVEGKEDILFWDFILKSCDLNNYHIEETGGYENLVHLMDKIIDDGARIIVACDCDHSPFLFSFKYINKQIIRTYGYSIENTMYCYHNIEQTVKRFARTRKGFHPRIDHWYTTFSEQAYILLKFDIANARFNNGAKIFGDKCSRFLKTPDSGELCPIKINRYLSSVISLFTSEQIELCEKLIDSDPREIRYLIKGHFLTNGIVNLIKELVLEETGIRVSISRDSLYSLMVNCLNHCETDCQDMKYLKTSALEAFSILVN